MAAKRITVIDLYLARQFVQLFVMCYISLAGLFTVIDALSNLDSFLGFAEKRGNLALILLRFYAFRWLWFFDLTSGVLALAAAVFAIVLFQSRNEMTALLAAGISKGRICLPILVAALTVSLVAAAGRELLLPRYARDLNQNPKDLAGEGPIPFAPRYDNRTDILLSGLSVVPGERKLRRPNFQLPTDGVLDRYGRYLAAEEAVYHAAAGDRPSGYRLKHLQQPAALLQKPSLIGRSGDTVIFTPPDTPWLKPDECFVVSDVDVDQLTGLSAWQNFSTAQMIDMLHNKSLDYGAEVKVAVHSRLVRPFLDANLLLLGLPLVLARANRNIFVAVALCLGIVMSFSMTIYVCQYLGSAVYLSPQLAAWLPLLVFVPAAAGLAGPLLE